MQGAHLIDEFLEGLRDDDFEDVPDTITTLNVNERLLCPEIGEMTFLEAATGWDSASEELTKALLKLGATITFSAMRYALDEEQMYVLLKHGADPNMVNEKDGTVLLNHVRDMNLSVCCLLAEHGAKIPPNFDRIAYPCIVFRAEEIEQRLANHRNALVALVAYCRRSPYHALRAWYRQLAMELWRRRRPLVVWNLEETQDLTKKVDKTTE